MNNNTLEIRIEISNYDEIIEKLKNIKKLLNEIKDIQLDKDEIKESISLIIQEINKKEKEVGELLIQI